MPNRPNHPLIRNLQSVGRMLDKSASSLFRWASTDHSGIGRMLELMPKLSFLDSILYSLLHLLIAILGIILQIVWWYLIIAYGIPWFLFGHS